MSYTPLCLSSYGYHTHSTTVETTFPELYGTIHESIESVVLAHSNVCAGIVTCTALANDDVACYALFTSENLDAQSLSV